MKLFAMTKKRALLIGALAVAALVVWQMTREPATPVEIAEAARGPLEVTVDEDGRTRTVDRYVVTAPVAGELRRMALREGSDVNAGDIIAHVEPLPLDASTRARLEAELRAAESRNGAADATLERARAARDQARREYERRQALLAEGGITTEQLEQYALAFEARKEELRNAEAAARAATSDVEAVRAALLGTTGGAGAVLSVRAPTAGRVLRVPERSARIVRAGEPLAEIGDTDVLEGVVDILTVDAVRVEPGMPVRITGWGGPDFETRVRTVEPSAFTRVSALGVEEQRVNVIIDLAGCPAELGDGYRIEARIRVWFSEDALTVPSSALFRSGDAWRVFVVEEGRARERVVTPGERGGARTQIVTGLEAGETVILFPGDRITEGTAVSAAGGPG